MPKITDGYHEGRGVPKLKDELLTHPGKCFLKQGQKKKKWKWLVPTFLSLGMVFTVGWKQPRKASKIKKLTLGEKLLMQTIKEDFEVTIISIAQNIHSKRRHSKRRLGVLGNQIYD